MRTGGVEPLFEHDQPFHFSHLEQRLALGAAFELMHADQFRAQVSDAVTLRLGQPRP